MPCNSDYLKPSKREQELQRAAKLLIYVIRNDPKNSKGWIQPCQELLDSAENIYCTKDWIPALCRHLGCLNADELEELVYGNPKDSMCRDLADWWETHQAADAARIAKEKEQVRLSSLKCQALDKLTDEEIEALGL